MRFACWELTGDPSLRCLIQFTDNTEPEVFSSYLSRLVLLAFEDQEDSGCIKMNEDNVEPMMLGSIASRYYLSYVTVSMFGSNIGSDTSLEVFLHINPICCF